MKQIVIGTAQLGLDYGVANKSGKISELEADKILKLCREKNIAFFDTALGYGDSEKNLGKLLGSYGKIYTKGLSFSSNVIRMRDIHDFQQGVQQSFKNLKRQSVEGIYIHNPQDLLKEGGSRLFKVLNDFKSAGRINKIGVSVYTTNELNLLLKDYDFDLVQIPLNIFNQSFLSDDYLESIKEKGIEIHARSIFLQGLIFFNEKTLPKKFLPYKNFFKDYSKKRENLSLTVPELAIGFINSVSSIDKVVIGIDSSTQLLELIDTFKNIDKNVLLQYDAFSTDNEQIINPNLW